MNRTERNRTEQEENQLDNGILYLVGTPIGNLSDISPRALEILSGVDMIAAEDTRRTAILLNKYNIRKPLESYHEFNKEQKGLFLVEQIEKGKNIALVSDAGMPCISDPGAELVAVCADRGIPVIVIPGPCAAVTALSGSGLDSSKFVFEGFLPSSGKGRKERLLFLQKESRTMVFYEAPHRVKKTLKDFNKNEWTDRRITFARELTKVHEEFIRTSVKEAELFYETTDPRGEYVIILEGLDEFKRRNPIRPESVEPAPDQEIAKEISRLMSQGKSIKEISVEISAMFPLTKKEAYALAQQMKDHKSL